MFNDLKHMRQLQAQRHAPHLNADTRAGAAARLAPVNDLIVDWFVLEITKRKVNPNHILEVYNEMAAACLAMIVRSIAKTIEAHGNAGPILPGHDTPIPPEVALITLGLHGFERAFEKYLGTEVFVSASGEEARKAVEERN